MRPVPSVGPGAKNNVGPNLGGFVGRKAGTEEGFSYSDAMKNSGITWDEATFEEWHHGPQEEGPRQQDDVRRR